MRATLAGVHQDPSKIEGAHIFVVIQKWLVTTLPLQSPNSFAVLREEKSQIAVIPSRHLDMRSLGPCLLIAICCDRNAVDKIVFYRIALSLFVEANFVICHGHNPERVPPKYLAAR